MNSAVLQILDLFRGLFHSLGIDYVKMRRIVQMKLTMDERRVPTVFSQTKLKEGNQFVKSLGIYVLYGLVLIPLLFFPGGVMLQMGMIFGVMIFIIMSSLIGDFSSVLLDVRDRTIVNTKPVDARTANAAKLVHIGIYISMITVAFIGMPSIVMIFKKGIGFFLIYAILVLLMLLFIIALTALVYMLILKLFDGERLKDIVNYVQILLTVGIFVGYQILARSFDVIGMSISYNFHWWHVFIPPLWFGAPFALMLQGERGTAFILLSVLAVVVPILSILVYSRLMPLFERNLQKLLGSAKGLKKKREFWAGMCGRLLCRKKQERACFRFAWQMMRQEREFKLKVYPSLGIGFVAPFIFIFNLEESEGLAELKHSNGYLTIYIALLIAGSVIMMLRYSEKFKGRWLYHVAPIGDLSVLDRAAVKAGLAKLFLPLYIVQSGIFIWLFGSRIILDLVIVFIVGVIYSVINYRVGNDGDAPFSQPIGEFQSGTAKQMIFLLIPAIFAGLHYFVIKSGNVYALPIYFVLLLIGTVLLWKMSFRNRLAN